MWLPGEIQVRKIDKNRANVHVGEVSNLIWNICRSVVACCSFMISNFKTSCEGRVKLTHLDTCIFIKLKKKTVVNQTQYQRSFGMLNSAWFLISPFLLPPSPLKSRHPLERFIEGAVTSESFKIWNVWITGFPSSCQSLGFPTASSNIHCGITNVSEKSVSGTKTWELRFSKQGPLMKWAMTKDLDLSTLIYHYLSIYVYGFDWPWPCWNTTHPLDLLLVEGDHFQELQKPHESTTWKEESGAYEAKKLATISLVFLSKQENITGNLLQGQISVHHDNFQVSTWIHQSGSNKIPTTLAHDSFNLQISRVNDLESPLNFTRLVHVPNIQLLLLDSTWQSGDMRHEWWGFMPRKVWKKWWVSFMK